MMIPRVIFEHLPGNADPDWTFLDECCSTIRDVRTTPLGYSNMLLQRDFVHEQEKCPREPVHTPRWRLCFDVSRLANPE
jgi:hypothetical protein